MKYKGCRSIYYVNIRVWVLVWTTAPLWYSGVLSYHPCCEELHQHWIKYLSSQWIVQCCTIVWPPKQSYFDSLLFVSWNLSRFDFSNPICSTKVMSLGDYCKWLQSLVAKYPNKLNAITCLTSTTNCQICNDLKL